MIRSGGRSAIERERRVAAADDRRLHLPDRSSVCLISSAMSCSSSTTSTRVVPPAVPLACSAGVEEGWDCSAHGACLSSEERRNGRFRASVGEVNCGLRAETASVTEPHLQALIDKLRDRRRDDWPRICWRGMPDQGKRTQRCRPCARGVSPPWVWKREGRHAVLCSSSGARGGARGPLARSASSQ